MLFLRIGWMDYYEGQTDGDRIQGGGGFVEEHKYGHEVFNFKPHKGRVYGYAQPSRGGHNQWKKSGIKIERLGASKDQEAIDGVLAIWIANKPKEGNAIVGWYRNARVFRHWQEAPPGSGRRLPSVDKELAGYYIEALAEDAILLPTDERSFDRIPSFRKGGMGQSNVWYADDQELHSGFRRDVLAYIEKRGQVSKSKKSGAKGAPHQSNLLLRQKVERIAMEMTENCFRDRGYDVKPVDKLNRGWDLEAVRGKINLRLEVKGLSGPEIGVELTPNEYAKMQEFRDSYRLCVVTSALTKPMLTVFAYSHDIEDWADQRNRDRRLSLEERVAARCSAT